MRDIRFNCRHCNQSLEAPADMRGTTIPCPICAKPISIPGHVRRLYAIGYGLAGIAILLLMSRIDYRYPMDCEYPCFNRCSFLFEATCIFILAVAAIIGLYLPQARYLPLRARKWTLRICFALLPLVACAMAVPSRDRFDEYYAEIRWRWLLKTEPNALNRMIRAYGDWNLEIVLPTSSNGVVITESIATDLVVELSRKGVVSIHNACMDASILAAIIANRTRRFGTFRVFIWADKDAPPASRDRVVEILLNYGTRQSYFVVASPIKRKNRIDFLAVPVRHAKPDEN